jgi:hypothetical protein
MANQMVTKGAYLLEMGYAHASVLLHGASQLTAAHGEHLAAASPQSSAMEASYVFPQKKSQQVPQELRAGQERLTPTTNSQCVNPQRCTDPCPLEVERSPHTMRI